MNDTVAITTEDLEGVAECDEILGNLMDSIERHGNYSVESTLGFLNAARQCLSFVREIK